MFSLLLLFRFPFQEPAIDSVLENCTSLKEALLTLFSSLPPYKVIAPEEETIKIVRDSPLPPLLCPLTATTVISGPNEIPSKLSNDGVDNPEKKKLFSSSSVPLNVYSGNGKNEGKDCNGGSNDGGGKVCNACGIVSGGNDGGGVDGNDCYVLSTDTKCDSVLLKSANKKQDFQTSRILREMSSENAGSKQQLLKYLRYLDTQTRNKAVELALLLLSIELREEKEVYKRKYGNDLLKMKLLGNLEINKEKSVWYHHLLKDVILRNVFFTLIENW
jgi:hypothetical protein